LISYEKNPTVRFCGPLHHGRLSSVFQQHRNQYFFQTIPEGYNTQRHQQTTDAGYNIAEADRCSSVKVNVSRMGFAWSNYNNDG
jgi:hypothetical protein